VLGRDVVGQPIVVAMVADEGCQQRVELERAFEVILEQLVERGGIG
jgi:hypothetical protein